MIILVAVGIIALSSNVFSIETDDLGLCPQSREKTPKAPQEYLKKKNPLEKTSKNLKKGKLLYMVRAKTLQCKHCHGVKGDGRGGMASDSFPAPRNFTCKAMMDTIPDGQIFWAIMYGLPHTSMPSYEKLKEKQIWQLVLYIREFAK